MGLHKAARGGEGCEIEPGEVRLTSDGPLDGVSRAKSLCSSISFSTSMCLLMRMPGLGEGRRPGQPTADKGKSARTRVGSWIVELVGHAADRQGKLAPPPLRWEVTETMGSSDQEAAIGHSCSLAWGLLLIRRIGTIMGSLLG